MAVIPLKSYSTVVTRYLFNQCTRYPTVMCGKNKYKNTAVTTENKLSQGTGWLPSGTNEHRVRVR